MQRCCLLMVVALMGCADARVEELQRFCDTLDVDGDGWFSRIVENRCCEDLRAYGEYHETSCIGPEDVDCNDDDAAIFPGQEDTADDGVDSNCDGVDGLPPYTSYGRCNMVRISASGERDHRVCCLVDSCAARDDGTNLPEVRESCDDMPAAFGDLIAMCRQQ